MLAVNREKTWFSDRYSKCDMDVTYCVLILRLNSQIKWMTFHHYCIMSILYPVLSLFLRTTECKLDFFLIVQPLHLFLEHPAIPVCPQICLFQYSSSQNKTINVSCYIIMHGKFVLVLNVSSRWQLSINHTDLYTNGMNNCVQMTRQEVLKSNLSWIYIYFWFVSMIHLSVITKWSPAY